MRALRALAARWREVVVILVALVVGNVALEVAYRVYQYTTLPGRLFRVVAAMAPGDADGLAAPAHRQRYVFDTYAGYLYGANYEGAHPHPWNTRYRMNSHGHVSRFEYPKDKPAGEYRIAAVGDSMTAGLTNNIRWTELLEADLNASQSWKASVGGKFTRVINFAVDGMGMVQFAGVVRHHVMGFGPDMILVNFVTDDILRRLRYPLVPGAGKNRDANIRAFVQTYLDRIDWFSLHPELIAATVGRSWGMKSQLPLGPQEILAAGPANKYTDRREAIATSRAAVTDILAAFPNTLFLQIPLFHELDYQDVPEWRGLVEDLRTAVPEAKIVSLRPQMEALLVGKRIVDRPELAGLTLHQLTKFPDDRKPEIYRWFYLPEDAHYTDYGITLYEREVAKLLIARQRPPAAAR